MYVRGYLEAERVINSHEQDMVEADMLKQMHNAFVHLGITGERYSTVINREFIEPNIIRVNVRLETHDRE